MNEETTERFYNQKTMTITVATVGVAAYLLGKKRGVRIAYVEGLREGMLRGLEEGRLEGYVNAIADVASVMRKTTEEE